MKLNIKKLPIYETLNLNLFTPEKIIFNLEKNKNRKKCATCPKILSGRNKTYCIECRAKLIKMKYG